MLPRPLIPATLAAVVSMAVLFPILAQDRGGYGDEVSRRIVRWQTDPALRPYARVTPPERSSLNLPQPAASRSATRGRRMSLHIGVNKLNRAKYPDVEDLEAAESDAQAMADLARAFGAETTLYLGEHATTANVLAALTRASEELQAGDLYMVTFAGHGSLVEDFNKDKYPQMTDQAFCLHDRMLVDDEVVSVWPKFRAGVRVLLLLDSCHSGTSKRAKAEFLKRDPGRPAADRPDPLLAARGVGGGEPRIRAIRPIQHEQAIRIQKEELERATRNLRVPDAIERTQASIIRVAACRDDQVALEAGRNGLFTHYLLELWDGGRYAGSYRDFVNDLARLTSPYQEPTLDYYGEEIQRFLERPSFTP